MPQRILTLQFRLDASKEHEQQCISRFLSREDQIEFWDIFVESVNLSNPAEYLPKFDKLVLGGNGAQSIAPGHKDNDYQKVHFILTKIKPLINYVLENDFPTFGTCFGHQLLGYFLGASVVYDHNQAETGFSLIQLTKEASQDKLFTGVNSPFYAVVGHQDSLADVPPGAVLLAFSDKCKVQAFRYKNNIYGTQFHGELNDQDLLYRLNLFPQYRQHALEMQTEDSSQALLTLQNFLKQN